MSDYDSSNHVWATGNLTSYVDDIEDPAEKLVYIATYARYYRTALFVPSVFGFVILGLYFLAVLSLGFFRLLRLLVPARYASFWRDGRLGMLSRHFTEKPLVGKRRAQRYSLWHSSVLSMHVPARVHTLIITLVCLANLLVSFGFYETTDGLESPYYKRFGPSQARQLARYIAVRTGILSLYFLPITILLSGRNSPTQWVSGMSFSTAMLYHRWAARLTMFHALVHSVAYTEWERIIRGLEGIYELLQDDYIKWGCVSTAFFVAAVFCSIQPIRERWFELFLISHIIFVILAIVGLWYHLKLLEEDYRFGDLYALMWLSMAAWIFDRLARFARIAFASFSLVSAPRFSKGTATLVGSDTILLKVQTVRKIAAAPGQYINICIPSLQAWTVHPFTIIDTTGTQIDVAIKIQHGFTRRLHKKITASGDRREWSGTVLVEGSYGPDLELEAEDDLFLFGAGIGITPCLSVLLHHARKLAARSGSSTDVEAANTTAPSLRLVWAVKSTELLQLAKPYLDEVDAALEKARAKLAIDVYVTEKNGAIQGDISILSPARSSFGTAAEPEEKKAADEAKVDSDGHTASNSIEPTKTSELSFVLGAVVVNVHHIGRPVIASFAEEATAGPAEKFPSTQHRSQLPARTLAIVSCGPATFTDDVRSLALHISRSRPTVYHEESFNY